MDTRSLTRLAFAAAAFFMAGATAAMAEDDCKSAVVAEGKPAALRDLGAYPNSLFCLALRGQRKIWLGVQLLALLQGREGGLHAVKGSMGVQAHRKAMQGRAAQGAR